MPVTQVVFTPDSRKLLSAGHDRTVREWDAIWGGEPRIVCHSPTGFAASRCRRAAT